MGLGKKWRHCLQRLDKLRTIKFQLGNINGVTESLLIGGWKPTFQVFISGSSASSTRFQKVCELHSGQTGSWILLLSLVTLRMNTQ